MKKIVPFICLLLISWAANAQNFGLQLDGQAGSVALCDSDDYDIGEGFTIEAWIYANEWRAEAWQGSIATKDQNNPAGFAFRAGKNGTLSMVMAVNNDWYEVQSDQIMNTNQWYHVATTVSNNTLTLYINGEVVNSGVFSGNPTHNTQIVTIGASTGFPGRVWDGILDEIRIWNVARSQQEISDNQQTALTGSEPGLVTYLPMNEGAGNVLGNLVGSPCNGTGNGLDGDAWQDGWSIPTIDAGVVRIDAPDVLSLYERPVHVSVTIQNYGSDPVSNIPIDLDVNGLPALSGTYAGTLQPGAIDTYTFDTPLDLTDNNTNLIVASTEHPDDPNALNNSGTYRYKKPDDGTILNILNEEPHNFGGAGQTQFTVINLPEHMEDYEQLLLHFSLECPTGGCDPWDQPAFFSIIDENGEEIEIARFITPYGIDCGDWTVDVTDFKSIMKGQVTFKSYIQVWGPSGWLVNTDLEFVATSTPVHQKLTELWYSQYWVYGDPSVMNDNLPEQTANIATNTQSSHLRMTITGHGQGNTENAAEFSQKTHDIIVDGAVVDNHYLWKDDCGQNPCSNQGGNWTPSRAGWCPGQQVTPYVFNLTGNMTPGSAMVLDYELEEYTNFLNTGYNDGSHTEPHYRIAGYLIENSDTRFEEHINLRAEVIEIDINGGNFQNLTLEITNTGSETVNNPVVSYFVNEQFIAEEGLSIAIAPGESYSHTFSSVDGFSNSDDNLIFGVVTAVGDQNINDNATKLFIDESLVSTKELAPSVVNIYPNPTAGQLSVELSEQLLNGQVYIFDAQGRNVATHNINNTLLNLSIENKGLYLVQIKDQYGAQLTRKVLVK